MKFNPFILITFIASTLFIDKNLSSKDFKYTMPGIRANSIGTAFSSIADDPYAIFYNPAGLNMIKDWQISATINRKLSDKNLGEFTLAYIRPIPEFKNGVFGFGYDAIRQSNKGKMDNYLFSYSNEIVLKYFQLPILYGGNIRITSIRYPQKTHLGIGFDAGCLLRSVNGYNFSFVLSKFMFGMGEKITTLTFGTSYLYKQTTFSMDLRITGSYGELFYGIETKFNDDLLRVRIGKGVNLDNKDFVMIGGGVNFDPIIIDLGFSYPYRGFNINAGNYGFSLTYKFTGPTYHERMYSEASQKAKELNLKSKTLKEEISTLEKELKNYQTQKNMLETDITILNTKLLELKNEIKNKEIELFDLELEKTKPKEKKKEEPVVIKKEEKWPKLHKVEKGETLRSISSKYYGTPSLWKLIYEENQDKIFKGLPKEGDILTIPPPKKYE